MDNKLCRTCGRSGQNFVNIFKTEGLKNKVETCLPIIVSQHCLLPETLCSECLQSIETFYVFTKSCLQNIIILEKQLDVQESCLKANRRKDKSCLVSLPSSNQNKDVQTEDYLNVLLGCSRDLQLFNTDFPLTGSFLSKEQEHSKILVDYDIDSESNSSDKYDENDSQSGQVLFGEKLKRLNMINNFIDSIIMSKDDVYETSHRSSVLDQGFISEITDRKNSQKRKSDSTDSHSPKMCRIETGNKRKCSKPKKLEKCLSSKNQSGKKVLVTEIKKEIDNDDEFGEENNKEIKKNIEDAEEYQGQDQMGSTLHTLPLYPNVPYHVKLNPTSLAEHFMKVQTKVGSQPNVESSNFESGESCIEKKKRDIPSLLKISDLKRSESFEDSPLSDHQTEDYASFHLNITCPSCLKVFSTKTELFVHLQLNHSEVSIYLCGICLKLTNSASNLRVHVLNCFKIRPVTNRYFCQVCCFGDDNYRSMESHVLVHNFLWQTCQKEVKNFDPEDYIQKNRNFVSCASPIKNFSCLECSRSDFDTFRKFSTHRRNVHSIFHCDLCNKFYGRNSHLWKHVNRLHKNHPSITCQVCFKTSASKYHLAQHFAKIHQAKIVIKNEVFEDNEEQKCRVDELELESARTTFKKKDFTDQETANTSNDEHSINQSSQSENDNSMDHNVAPKEIDPSHDLYTNILTNYTPPRNEGDYKCPKCSKGFHKRMLLRKHKKNCRPKLQKDLLTRCKTCARIFKDRQSLAKHLINYHSDYECEICNEKVPSKCEIVSHIRFQHPSSHLICSVCENILRCKKDLLEHLANHENSFVCQFCGDGLTSKVKLKMHILSLHRKILSLSCGICLKLFETQRVLRNHVALIHKGQLVPLISCPVCGKNYGSKWKTFDHVNKSHGRFFKACKICLEIYETESQLEAHLKTVHQNQQIISGNATKSNSLANMNTPPVKSEEPHLNLNNNENNFDTDSEGNTEETENSQTSETEDDENSRPYVAESERPNSAEITSGFPRQESKMSMLEKRLLGKAFQDNMPIEKNVAGNSYKTARANKPTGALSKEKLKSPTIKRDDENNFPPKKTDNSHHSKRTVYENSNDPSFCEICHKTWPAKKHLWQHYIRCHKRVAATVCGICLKTNNNYETLQTHLRETHPTLLHGQGFGSNFICRICGRYHNASSKLRLHMVIHEKFDWTVLEKFPPIYKSKLTNIASENGPQHVVNGAAEKDKKGIDILNGNEDMFNAMIEQVEESTSSTDDIEPGHRSLDSTTDSDDTHTTYAETNANKHETNQGQDNENRLSFSNLLQTLRNHNQFQALKKTDHKPSSKLTLEQSEPVKKVLAPFCTKPIEANFRAQSVIRIKRGNNILAPGSISSETVAEKVENVGRSYLSEESSSVVSECEPDGDEIVGSPLLRESHCGDSSEQDEGRSVDDNIDNAENGDHYYSRNIFRPKPEEIDSAIKSISDPCKETQNKTEYTDFNESVQQGNCLNETEIESAVGSIL